MALILPQLSEWLALTTTKTCGAAMTQLHGVDWSWSRATSSSSSSSSDCNQRCLGDHYRSCNNHCCDNRYRVKNQINSWFFSCTGKVGWLLKAVRRARKVRDRSHCCTKANDNHHAGSRLRLPEVGGRLNSTFILRSSDGSSKLRRGIKSLPLHVPFHCLLACLLLRYDTASA